MEQSQAVEIIADSVQFLGPASDAPAEPRAHAREPAGRARHRYSRRARSARTRSRSESRARCGLLSADRPPSAQMGLAERCGRTSAAMASEANGGCA